MKDESYWKKFWASGRVEDYLTYAGMTSHDSFPQWDEGKEVPKAEHAWEPLGGTPMAEYPMGECHYAGFNFCDRYGDQPDTCG